MVSRAASDELTAPEAIEEGAPTGLRRAAIAVVRAMRSVGATRLVAGDEHVGDREQARLAFLHVR